MRPFVLALSTAALVMSGAAMGQSAPTSAAEAGAAKPDMTRALVKQRAEAAFARLDANRDGTIDTADHAARRAGLFDRIDADRNGSISRAEFDAMHAQRADRGAERAGRKGAPGQRGKMMAQAVNRQAFVDRALDTFDRVDANRDGTVTQAERTAARQMMRQQKQTLGAPRQQS